MCEPATIAATTAFFAKNAALITAASALGGGGLSIMSAQSQAAAQNEMADRQNASADAQTRAINQAQVDSYAQLGRAGVEDRENFTMESEALRREKVARMASARVSAAGSGVSGLSVDALLLDLSGKGLQAGTTAEMNYARSESARADQAVNLQNRTAGELSRVQRGGPKTSVGVGAYLGAGLKIAGAGVDYSKATYKK